MFDLRFAEVMKFFKMVKKQGLDHYSYSPIVEYDMGTHILRVDSYKVYSRNNTLVDEGSYVFQMV